MSDVCSVNLNIFGASNLTFNFGAANAVVTAANAAANAIEGQTGTRASYVSTGSKDFKGYFSELFTTNAAAGASDASELAIRLREVATFMGTLSEAAARENGRRQRAREWKQRVESRKSNFIDRTWDSIFGEEPPPREEPSTPPVFNAQSVSQSVRQHPTQGGGGGGGTSSARPSDLRSYASGTAALNSGLDTHPGTLSGAVADFMSTCDFGAIDVGPVLTGFRAWQTANTADVAWANTVAASFEAAGAGEGIATVSNSSLNAALAAAGVNASRSNLIIAPPQAFGGVPTTGFANDPINTSTGNFLESEIDLSFMGTASSLKFDRMYNSLNPLGGVFGTGWSSILDTAVTLDDEGATFIQSDGRHITFARLDQGWDRGDGENLWLTQEPITNLPVLVNSTSTESVLTDSGARSGEALVIRNNEGAWWAFTLTGIWLGQGGGPGNAIVVVRDGDGTITQLAHEYGRFINVEYVGSKVAVLTSSDGRRVEFIYDSSSRLSSVATEVGTRTYRWNDQGLIDRVISASGVVECVNTYDIHGRVIEQVTEFGRRVRFAYLPGRVTAISDLDGTNANTWVADPNGRLIGVIDTDDRRQSMAYDGHGNLVSVTARDKSVTVHGYDERGRKVRTVTPLGGDITYAYDNQDRVTQVVTEHGGVVIYEYDTEQDRNPSKITDAAGGVSRLVWNGNLLTHVTDPEGVKVVLAYDVHGDLISTTNAAGDTAILERDHAGRVIASVSPSGHRTKFNYNAAGMLESRQDPDGSVWRFEYGVGGKLTGLVDPYGAQTTMEYGPHGQVIKVVDPLARETSREFGVMGNISATHLANGAQWQYGYDGLARLGQVTDPAGNTWNQEYDLAGNVASIVDPTGVTAKFISSPGSQTAVTEFDKVTTTFDHYGRPTKTQHDQDNPALVTYDLSGRPVEFLDADGGLTILTRDLSGRVVQVVTPGGNTSTYEYDACGRPSAATDANGDQTRLVYNADSLVVSRIDPSGLVTTIDYDECGRVISQNVPGKGVSQLRYDKAGRIVFSQDSMSGQRRFRYDSAGQLTQAINGLGGITSYSYDANGRLVTITDPLGAVTTREYDHLDKVVAVTDPLGRVMTAEYDSAGRQTAQTDPDGNTIAWAYDQAGLEKTVRLNGTLASSITRDARKRTVTVKDYTDPNNQQSPVIHELAFNRLGKLISQSSGGTGTCWGYDRDGNRTEMTTADGQSTRYTRDMVGRVIAVDHPSLGNVTVTYDPSGNITGTHTGDISQTWEYDGGYPVAHTVTDSNGTRVTTISRDNFGRITAVAGDGEEVTYTYDVAGQLAHAQTDTNSATSWQYDQAGRLVQVAVEVGAGHETTDFEYDNAGQLLSRISSAVGRTQYTYDGVGRRSQELTADKETTYRWDPRGWLMALTVDQDNAQTQVIELWVNILGELARANDTEVKWDSAAHLPALTSLGDRTIMTAPGGITLTNAAPMGPDAEINGWRVARATDPQDPWAVLAAIEGQGAAIDGQAAALGITQGGTLHLGGLEWMGARLYDSPARGFLTVDPLQPNIGSGWGGNPYAFAGNNPLLALDPLGLSPVSDADLDAYAQANQGGLANATDWVGDNWEVILGGAAIVVGVGLMFTGVGGPAGIALLAASGGLISGGISTISQKTQTGEVDWGRVGVDTAVGAVMGGAGGVGAKFATSVMASAPAGQAGRAILANVAVNGGISSTASGVTYLAKNDWQVQNGWELAGAVTGGFVAGSAGGLAGPMGGSVGMHFNNGATGVVSRVSSVVMGGMATSAGSITNDIVSGRPIDFQGAAINAGVSSASSAVLSHYGGTINMHGTDTMRQMPYFHPRTVSGTLNIMQPNSTRLWGGAISGSLVGGVVDETFESVTGG